MNLITFKLGRTERYWTTREITLEFLEQLINMMQPALSTRIVKVQKLEEYLEVEGSIVALKQDGLPLDINHQMLSVEFDKEVVL